VKFQGHLLVDDATLAPSSEWDIRLPGWVVVRVDQGQGYWLGCGQSIEANTGDLLVLSPLREGVLRASQLGPVTLQYFRLCPELLSGVLTLAERHCLEKLAGNPERCCLHLPAGDPAAVEFARIFRPPRSNSGFLARCRVLQVAAGLFDKELARPRPRGAAFLPASKRIKVFLNQLTEAEIMDLSPVELAMRCGCSVRHFNRLFHASFGVSLRAKQAELRLLKARQLLSETNATVSSIAIMCGYRHLGLFNAMFKKQFSLTPTECRKQSRLLMRRHGRNGNGGLPPS
jgi:AraC-like DNA-binding protein